MNANNRFPAFLMVLALAVAFILHYQNGHQHSSGSDRLTPQPEQNSHQLRRLSSAVDINTGENLRTINGTIPEVSCPLGHYRPSGSTKLFRVSGNRQDGCFPCPKGRYGDSMGLKHSSCTAACPVGTYSGKVGLKSIDECMKCPKGTFGKNRGLTTSECSGVCPRGKYTDKEGSPSCKVCPKKYYMHQCPLDDLMDVKE